MKDPRRTHALEQAGAALRDVAVQLAEYLRHLTEAGFTREEALRIVIAYQATALGLLQRKDGEP